jgi:hypothetical protein
MVSTGGREEFRAPSLRRQIADAQEQYAYAYERLTKAAAFYKNILAESEQVRRLFPDAARSCLAEAAIQNCAYWDAEASAAEIRLARIGRIAVAFDVVEEHAPKPLPD